MDQTAISQLSDAELLDRKKKIKAGKITDALMVGFMIGVAVYSTVKNGWGLLTFLPLLIIPVVAKNKKMYDAVEAELKGRGL